MRLRQAKKILKYSKRDHLATMIEFIDGYSKETLRRAEQRYVKWWHEIDKLKEVGL